MIDAVGTVTVNTSVLARSGSHGGSSRAPVASVQAVQSVAAVSNSRIRMDNLLNLAIIEWRLPETGDVVHQTPTEGQIRAFQRADGADRPAPAEPSAVVEAPQPSVPQQQASAQSQPQTPIATASVVV